MHKDDRGMIETLPFGKVLETLARLRITASSANFRTILNAFEKKAMPVFV
jgi:hypothetical protein